MSEHTRMAALSAEIAKIQQDLEQWRRHERDTAAQLDRALTRLQQYTRRGQFPDPIVSAAVNNHSVALNHMRSRIAGLQSRKTAAEREHMNLSLGSRNQA